jgi:hypothetical protein
MSGTTGLMQALTVACDETEDPGSLQFYLTAAALTADFILFGVLALFLIAVVPAVLDWMALPDLRRGAVSLIRWPILAGLGVVDLSIVYRLARSEAQSGGSALVLSRRPYCGSSLPSGFPYTSPGLAPTIKPTARSEPS